MNCIRFSPDGARFISVSSDKRGLLYDAKTADMIGELSTEDGHTGSIYAVSWSPDSKRVILAQLNANSILMLRILLIGKRKAWPYFII